jgi:hypothetical protein
VLWLLPAPIPIPIALAMPCTGVPAPLLALVLDGPPLKPNGELKAAEEPDMVGVVAPEVGREEASEEVPLIWDNRTTLGAPAPLPVPILLVLMLPLLLLPPGGRALGPAELASCCARTTAAWMDSPATLAALPVLMLPSAKGSEGNDAAAAAVGVDPCEADLNGSLAGLLPR